MERSELPDDDILAPSQGLITERERGIGTTLLGSTPMSVGTLLPDACESSTMFDIVGRIACESPFESFSNPWGVLGNHTIR